MNSGGLKVPNMVGLGEAEQQQAHSEWSTFEDVDIQLMRDGIMQVEKPTVDCPRLDKEQLTTLDEHRYGTIYSALMSWFAYMSDILARTKAKQLEVENEMAYVSASMKLGAIAAAQSANEKKPSDVLLKDMIIVDPRYKALGIQLQNITQMRQVLEPQVVLLDHNLKMVSRQIELKRIEMEKQRIGNAIAFREHGVR